MEFMIGNNSVYGEAEVTQALKRLDPFAQVRLIAIMVKGLLEDIDIVTKGLGDADQVEQAKTAVEALELLKGSDFMSSSLMGELPKV
jgi:hypothetical protein